MFVLKQCYILHTQQWFGEVRHEIIYGPELIHGDQVDVRICKFAAMFRKLFGHLLTVIAGSVKEHDESFFCTWNLRRRKGLSIFLIENGIW